MRLVESGYAYVNRVLSPLKSIQQSPKSQANNYEVTTGFIREETREDNSSEKNFMKCVTRHSEKAEFSEESLRIGWKYQFELVPI